MAKSHHNPLKSNFVKRAQTAQEKQWFFRSPQAPAKRFEEFEQSRRMSSRPVVTKFDSLAVQGVQGISGVSGGYRGQRMVSENVKRGRGVGNVRVRGSSGLQSVGRARNGGYGSYSGVVKKEIASDFLERRKKQKMGKKEGGECVLI